MIGLEKAIGGYSSQSFPNSGGRSFVKRSNGQAISESLCLLHSATVAAPHSNIVQLQSQSLANKAFARKFSGIPDTRIPAERCLGQTYGNTMPHLRLSGQYFWRLSSVIRATSISSGETEPVKFPQVQVGKSDLKVLLVALTTALLATSNKVLYKMALVPMKEYPFFLAQFNTFGYVVVYFTVLFVRYKAGIVTDDMLNVPKGPFVKVGALEAIGLAVGMSAAAVLPAAPIPVLLQVFLVWQLLLSFFLLGKRYTPGQVVGCLFVIAGVVIVVGSGGGTDALQQTGIFWPLVMISSAFFQAVASILKESIFLNARKDVKGGNMDIFVVNSFGSLFQSLFVLIFLPFLSNVRGIPFHQLGSYLKDGAGCFFNVGAPVECAGSPLVPVAYVLVNLLFNVSALTLMKISSAIVSSLASTSAVPLAIFLFTLPLPYLGTPPPLPPRMLLGSGILIAGLLLYNISNPKLDIASKFK